MVRIAQVITGFPPYQRFGPQNTAFNLSSELGRRGHSSHVLTLKWSHRGPDTLRTPGMYVSYYRPTIGSGSIAFSSKFVKNMLSTKVDIVHIHEVRSILVETCARAACLRNIPYLVTTHGTAEGVYRTSSLLGAFPFRIYDVLTRRFVLKRAAAIVVSSQTERESIISTGIEKEKLHLIHHGIEIPMKIKTSRPATPPSTEPCILFVGRLSRVRNLPMLLRAFHLIREEYPDSNLVLCGDFAEESRFSSSEQLRQMILQLMEKLDLKRSVQFKGWLRGQSLWDQYLNSNLFLWTSYYDNFAYALVEASSCGLPIISTPVGVAPSLLESSHGCLVKMDDHVSMAKRAIELISDSSLWKLHSSRLIVRSEDFTISRMVDQYENLYKNILLHS